MTDAYVSDAPGPLTETGHLRKEFKDAEQCYNFAKRLNDEDQRTLSPARRQIMAMKGGYPPWRGVKRGGQTNLNFLEGEQALDARRIPYIRRLTEGQHLFDFTLRKELDPDILDDYERGLGESASSTLRVWRGHFQQLLRSVTDMIDFGLGIIMWPDSTDPRFKRIPRWDVFFEADAEPVVDDLNVVVIRDKWDPKRLLAAIDHEDSEDLGYNKKHLREALAYLATSQGSDTGTLESQKTEEAEREIRQNQYAATAIQPLPVYQVLFRDLETGEINLYVVAQIGRRGTDGVATSTAVYLRESKGAYEQLSHAIALFPLPSADTIQGLRGHGHRITPKAIASSRAKCIALDNHAFESTRMFVAQSGSSGMRLQIRQHGPFSTMPPEVAPVELPARPVLELDAFAISFLNEELRRGLTGNPLARNPQTSTSPERHRSKFQEQADLLDDNGLSEVEIGTFDYYLDACLAEFYRRLTLATDSGPGDDLRKYFRKQVEIHAVPETCWRDPGEGAISARRAIGSGSAMDQLTRSQALLAVAGALGERGSHEVLEHYLSVLVGPGNVRRFLKTFERLGGKTEQHWVASVETALALMGQGLLRPTGDQKDDSHLRQHLEGIAPHLQLAQSGEMPFEALAQFVGGLDILLPHMDYHLARLEQDETKAVQFDQARRAVEELRRSYNALRAIVEQRIEADAAEAQRQAEQAALAQQAPQLTPEEQHKLLAKQAEFEQKISQRGENFQRIQQERQAAHRLGEQRKDASTVRQELRKDAAAIREMQRKEADAQLEQSRKPVNSE